MYKKLLFLRTCICVVLMEYATFITSATAVDSDKVGNKTSNYSRKLSCWFGSCPLNSPVKDINSNPYLSDHEHILKAKGNEYSIYEALFPQFLNPALDRRKNSRIKIDKYEPNTKMKKELKFQTTDVGRTQPLFPKRNFNPKRRKRAATSHKEKLWPDGIIPYEVDGNYSGDHKALFKQAMRHWENYTCLSFIERNPNEHLNYILFIEKACGCCSYVGMKGSGAQVISIGRDCDKFGNVVHELGHVIGFWHEHTRPDRDDYIQINKGNIIAGQDHNFNKMSEADINSLGTKYDYVSVMHYSITTFSKNPYLETIKVPYDLPDEILSNIGQRIKLSPTDIIQTNLLYNCPVCGQTFQGNSANFSSPSYVNKEAPTNGVRCEWRIQGTHGEKIVLNISEIDILETPNCEANYLEVIDGYWHKSKVLAKYCGTLKLNDSIISSGSRMLVRYISQSPNGYKGFSATYEAVCGGELFVENEGHLESPNYPMEYRANKKCVWKLKVPEGFQVALKFQSFHVENHEKCYYDYVEIRDGFDADSPHLGTFCGPSIPPEIRSTKNYMVVKFNSDSSVGSSGFSAIFLKEYDECSYTEHGCTHDCVNTFGSFKCTCRIGYELQSDGKSCEVSCGGLLNNSNGSITSPSHPELYPPNKHCIWEVTVPTGHLITLNFTDFDVGEFEHIREECSNDKVQVFSKINNDSLKLQGTYCGSISPRPVTTETNVMRVVFNSNGNIEQSGFVASYYSYLDQCAVKNGGCKHYCNNNLGTFFCTCRTGHILDNDGKTCIENCIFEFTQPAGIMESPKYPNNTIENTDCAYHYMTHPGLRVRVRFITFELDDNPDCLFDYVQFHNGDSVKSWTLTPRLCGNTTPPVLHTFTNELFMVYRSEYGGRQGFQASYSTICGGRLKAGFEKKYIYSHSMYGVSEYENNLRCVWYIDPPSEANVKITFEKFDLEEHHICKYDFVAILDDLGFSEYELGRFCGTTIPGPIESEEGSIKLMFYTDDATGGKGFVLTYEAVEIPYVSSEEMIL